MKNMGGFQKRLLVWLGVAFPMLALLLFAAVSAIFGARLTATGWLILGATLLATGELFAWRALRILPSPAKPLAGSQQPPPGPPPAESAPPPASRQLTTATFTQNETLYRQLVALSPDGIALVDRMANINFVNPAGITLLGINSAEQLADISITRFFPGEQQAAVTRWLSKIWAGNNPAPIEQKLVGANQVEIYVELVGIPLQLDNTPFAQLLIHDISERKIAEAEIAQRNRELTILQSAGAAITSRLDLRYVLDTVAQEMTRLVGVERCVIFEWQETEDHITKIAQFGPEGWWRPLLVPERLDLAGYPLTRSVLEEQIPEQMNISRFGVDPFELAYMRQVGIKTLLMLPMVFQRRVLGLVKLEDSRAEREFTYQEISMTRLLANQAASAIENAQLFEQAQHEIEERQRAESALQQERAMLAQRVQERTAELSKANAELARASRLKDEFLAGMSHELRTPLNTIIGSSEILKTEVFGAVNEKQKKYASNIEESGRHLLDLINDILDLSKIEAGKVELEIQPVVIEAVCMASLRLVKQLAHKKRIQVSTRFHNSKTVLDADERRLKQILVNLLSNAIKFTREGGKIGIEVSDDDRQETVHFCVWDTGIGIAQDDMRKLFQPFVQLDSSLSRQYAGTGLGLSLVSRMTELHGGSVSLDSTVGQGSRFTVSLPYVRPGLPPDSAAPAERALVMAAGSDSQKSQSGPALILLADDNEENIHMLLDFLQAQGHQVVIARNGKEAVQRAREQIPDIILMDIQMPGMDGLEATRTIRTSPTLAKIPIIALTALAMPGDRERSLAAGANEHMSKPISPTRLLQTIDHYLNLTHR